MNIKTTRERRSPEEGRRRIEALRNVFEAAAHASSIGRPLNLTLTISPYDADESPLYGRVADEEAIDQAGQNLRDRVARIVRTQRDQARRRSAEEGEPTSFLPPVYCGLGLRGAQPEYHLLIGASEDLTNTVLARVKKWEHELCLPPGSIVITQQESFEGSRGANGSDVLEPLPIDPSDLEAADAARDLDVFGIRVSQSLDRVAREAVVWVREYDERQRALVPPPALPEPTAAANDNAALPRSAFERFLRPFRSRAARLIG